MCFAFHTNYAGFYFISSIVNRATHVCCGLPPSFGNFSMNELGLTNTRSVNLRIGRLKPTTVKQLFKITEVSSRTKGKHETKIYEIGICNGHVLWISANDPR